MALHGVRAVAAVEVLDADRHAFLLGVSNDPLKAGDAIVESFVERDFAALRIFGVVILNREGDHRWKARLSAEVDHLRLRSITSS